ncbi:MAG: glycosyltransferase family A protein [Bacteroidota bacterium]
MIVPVFNDADGLALCLRALEAQALPAGTFEVLVVDNGSDDDPTPIARQFSWARLVHESTPGAYAARNRGVEAATGVFLAFTDADCQPDPHWLKRAVQVLESDAYIGLVCGPVVMQAAEPDRPTAAETYEIIWELNQTYTARRVSVPDVVTANLVTRRTVMDELGRFDTSVFSGADAEWGRRVAEAGYEVCFDDEVIVYHRARHSLSGVVTRSRRMLGGSWAAAGDTGRQTIIRNALRRLRPRVRLYAQQFRRHGVTSWHRRAQFIAVDLAVVAGMAWEAVRLWAGGRPERR